MRNKISVVLLVVFIVGIFAPLAAMAQDEQIIRYPITTDPEHLNPFISDTIAIGTINRNIYEGLVNVDARTGDVISKIAESWEVSEDGLEYTFYIRPGVLFHDVAGVEYAEGEREVDAHDILWNYLTALSDDEAISIRAVELDVIEGAAAYTAGDAEEVTGLEVIDDHTFKITLNAADRLFLVNGMISITSPVAYEQLGESFNNTPVGTGPFQFVEWLRQDHLTLAANDEYYVENVPLVDGVNFINYGDAQTALLDYREDQLDFLFSFPSGQRTAIMNEFPDEFTEKPGLHTRYWGFNMETGFLAENKAVRQALSYTLDRVTAWEIFEEGARFPAEQGLLPPSFPASTASTIYNFDLDKARALLDEAGFPSTGDPLVAGGDGVRGDLPVIRIHLLESIASEAQVVVWLDALAQIGVVAETIVEDSGTYWDSIVTDETMIFQNGWAAGLIDPSDVFDFLILEGRGSMRYDDPVVNDLLRQARVEMDEEAREALYQQVHDIVMDEAVVIASAYSKVTWLEKPWVDGFNPGGGGTYTAPLWEVSLSN